MIPPDIRDTMREALHWMKDDSRQLRLTFGNDERDIIVQRIDAAIAYLDTLPAAPAPDWSVAPDWAQWWAMDSSGHAYWHSEKPRASERYLTWESSGDNEDACFIEHGNWRTTLQARPTEDK